MRRLIPLLLCISLAAPAFASRDFTAASSQLIDTNTTLGNWERTQAWSVVTWVRVKTNASGQIVSKQDATANVRGWSVLAFAGGSAPTVQVTIQNTTTNHIVQRTSSEVLALNTYEHLVVTYDGTGLAAGITFYINGSVSSKAAPVADTLGANTILNSVDTQIGAKGGSGAGNTFLNGILRRTLIYNVALTSQNVSDLFNQAVRPDAISGLQMWQEFGPSNDGAAQTADWSGNGNTGFVTNAVYSTTEPGGISNLLPNVGTTGAATLAGPLTRGAAPLMQNLGWVNGANNGRADQIGPGPLYKRGVGDYVGYIENDTGVISLDVGNQPAGNFDLPTILANSTDGTTWSFTSQDTASGSLFNVNNIVSGLTGGQTTTFKAAVHGETSIGQEFYDPDDAVWKAWFHGGNNAGTRQIYYATCTASCDTAGNWNVQHGGVAVLTVGAGGTWDALLVADARVVRVNPSLMLMIYGGRNAGSVPQIGMASSVDRGLTWTKAAGNPIIAVGAAGSWDSLAVYPGAFMLDAPTGRLLYWYGGGVSANVESIGFAYSDVSATPTITQGTFNPVLSRLANSSANGNIDFIQAQTINGYLDGSTYRFEIKADNGVGGTTGFRGRIEASMPQTVKGGGGLLTLKVGH